MCVKPTFVWVQRGPGYEKQPVSCRQCWRCEQNRLNDYIGRCLAEASVSEWVVTLTLTYANRDDLAERVVTPPHFQKFIRALRRRGHSLRYLACGEYGDLKARAHFHTILFGKGRPPEIPQQTNCHIAAWPHGFVYADWNADEAAIRYVCKYILKGEREQSRAVLRPWFTLSKKPPLGAEFFERKAIEAATLGVMPSGFEYLPPNGDRRRPYMMTGATRRDYLRAILRHMDKTPAEMRPAVGEWVARALDKIERIEHEERCGLTQAEFDEAFSEEMDRRRPTTRQINRALLEDNLDVDWHLMPNI